jgi:hypothetical protein
MGNPALAEISKPDMIQVAVAELTKQATDAAIAELSKKYLSLKINGLNDEKGFKDVHAARMDVRNRRIAVEKKRKELKEDALKFGKAVDAEAKRITGLLAPIEEHLEAEESAVENEKKRIKEEQERKEQERIQARFNRLFEYGCRFDGKDFSIHGFVIPQSLAKSANDEQYADICAEIEKRIEAENARIAEEERLRKEEEERLAKVREEQEAEARRLAEIARKQKEEEERIRAEQEESARKLQEEREALEREKREIEERKSREEAEKKRQEELEQARKEATAKARNEMLLAIGFQYPFDDLGDMPDDQWSAMYGEHKKAWDEKQNALFIAKMKEEKAAAEAEAKKFEEMKPDKEKLLKLADSLDSFELPALKHKKPIAILTDVKSMLTDTARFIREEVGQLKPRKGKDK